MIISTLNATYEMPFLHPSCHDLCTPYPAGKSYIVHYTLFCHQTDQANSISSSCQMIHPCTSLIILTTLV